MSNVITRRDFLVRQMVKEYPLKTIQEISRTVTELEYEFPKTDWDEKVFYDSGKPVVKKNQPRRNNNNRKPARNK